MLEQFGAQHRHQGERHDGRNQDRDGERHRELAKQPPDHILHEQQRNQHGDQRYGERDDGEADLARALQGRVERRKAELDVARDVLDHHDGIVDHEAGRDGQGHQGQVVQAEVGQIHDGEGADERQRNRQARNDRGRHVAQKQINDQHHQHDGERQFELDVRDGCPDGGGAIGEDGDIHPGRHRGLERRQQVMDSVDHVDDVGSRLTLHVEDQGGGRIHPAAELGVFGARDQRGHIAKPYRRTVLVGNDDAAVILRAFDLIVGIDRIGAARAVQRPLRPVLVGVVDGGAQVVEIQSVGGERTRVHHHPDRRPLAAAHAHDADALELRDLLRDARIGHVLDVRERHHLGGDAEREHRSIGRVDLGVDRRRRQVLRQQILRGADGRLHFLFGDVDGEG